MDRDKQTEHDHCENGIASPESELRQGIGAGQCDHDLDKKNRRCDDHSVEKIAEQRRFLESLRVIVDHRRFETRVARIAQLNAIFVHHLLLCSEEPASIGLDLARRFERIADHHVKRQYHDQRTEYKHGVAQRFASTGSLPDHE